MSAATNRTERLAKALKDARPDFTLHNARVFSRAVIEAPDDVFGAKPLTFLPESVGLKDVTPTATFAPTPVESRAPAGATWRGNDSLRKLAEAADARLTAAEEAFAAARDELERFKADTDQSSEGWYDHYKRLSDRAETAAAAVWAAKAHRPIVVGGDGPVPGYFMLTHTGRWLGLVASGGQVISTDPLALLSLSALVDEHGIDGVWFLNPLAPDDEPRHALRLVRSLQSVCPELGDGERVTHRFWKLLSRDFRALRGVFDMASLRASGFLNDEPTIGRLLDTWFGEDSMRAVAAATGM